eukprot:31121-Pelagococcus_subviridis.AAC.5
MPVGVMNGSLELMHAAAVSTGSKHCVTTPMMSIRPVAGSSGSCDRSFPSGVRSSRRRGTELGSAGFDGPSTSAIALRDLRRSIASDTVSSAGGSNACDKNFCTPALVIEHVCRHVASSAVL